MTTTKKVTIRSALATASSSKYQPKRAVSFSNVCKYDAPRRRVGASDQSVQSTDSRRRYQRRGSKTPAMLHLSRADLAYIQERRHSINCGCCDCCAIPTMMNSPRTTPKLQRRMSSGSAASCGSSSSSGNVVRSFPSSPCRFAEHTDYVITASSARQRRMSLMTALKQNLERSLILDTPTAVVKTIRRMSMDANRNYTSTLELLSHS